jgi:putative membrane protein
MVSNPPPPYTSSSPASDAQLRDWLALERTRMANERTLLAYARTAIMLAATGATILKLFVPTTGSTVTAWSLIALGGLTVLFGWRQFHRTGRLLANEGVPAPRS